MFLKVGLCMVLFWKSYKWTNVFTCVLNFHEDVYFKWSYAVHIENFIHIFFERKKQNYLLNTFYKIANSIIKTINPKYDYFKVFMNIKYFCFLLRIKNIFQMSKVRKGRSFYLKPTYICYPVYLYYYLYKILKEYITTIRMDNQ